MKTNRLFRLTDKEIEAVTQACISAKENGDRGTLQRAIDKMLRSQWYSNTQLFSPSEKSFQQPLGSKGSHMGNPRRFRFFVDTVRGPWFSIGIHLDFQAPKIDVHFWWWIISVGCLYMSEPPNTA